MNTVQISILVAGLLACSAVALPGLLPVLKPVIGGVTGTVQQVTSGVASTAQQVPTTLQGGLNAANQIFNNLNETAKVNTLRLTTVLRSALGGDATFDQVYVYLLTGVYIATGPNDTPTNSIGGLGLPTNTLCQLGVQYQYTSCYICNQDCYVAHNLWGGGCGASPITGNQTCLCAESADEAADRHLTPDSTATCASFNPVAEEESYLIALAFRARYIAVQCLVTADGSYDSAGCNVDCTQNHGFASGTCEIQKPNVPMPTGTYLSGNDKPTAFCICSHDMQPNTTFNAYGSDYSQTLLSGVTNYVG